MCATAVQEGHLIGLEAEHWDYGHVGSSEQHSVFLSFFESYILFILGEHHNEYVNKSKWY